MPDLCALGRGDGLPARAGFHLVTQVLDGAELSPAAAEHFDRCLGCMACMTACPSGVQYDRLIEAARARTDDPEHAPPVPPVPLTSAGAAPGARGAREGADYWDWMAEVARVDGMDEMVGGYGCETGRTAGGAPVGGGQHRPLPDRAARAAIFAVFPYPRRLARSRGRCARCSAPAWTGWWPGAGCPPASRRPSAQP